jgi:outer membrane protein OmpA-like peptidoglycan-associated protein
MQSSARTIAITFLLVLLAASAFAGDAKKPATNPPENQASDSEPAPQAPPAPTPTAKKGSLQSGEYPRGELFLGYSYVRWISNPSTLPGGTTVQETIDMIPGGVASITGNVSRWFGLTADFGGYGVHGLNHVDGQLYTYLFGPKFALRKGKWVLFADALGGGSRLNNSVNGVVNSIFFNSTFHRNSAAAAAGGGVDWGGRHVAVRLGEVEYLLTTFSDNHNDRQNNLRVSGGIVFRFGYPSAPAAPPVHHPPTATCSATPSTVHVEANEVAVIRADATSPDNRPLTYAWSATGGTVDGTGPEVRWNPGTSAPGTYTITARIDDGAGGTTTCTADVHLEPRPNRPPVISSCTASPASVRVGEKATITTTASDPDNDPLTYSYTATGGTVTGTGPTAQFDSTGLTAGHYTVTCHVDDGRGGTADGKADVEVQPPRELEMRLALHSIYFPTSQPTAKNPNGGLVASQQQTLLGLAEDFKKYLTFKPDAYVTLRGHTDPRGSVAYNQALSERRVGSVKNFLIEHGVPESAIKTEALGEEHQLTEAEVRQMTEQDPQVTAQQRATILKNLKVITLAQNRRVDVVLSTTGQTSTRLYPFNAADAANLLNPRATAGAKAPSKKPAPRKPAAKKPQ